MVFGLSKPSRSYASQSAGIWDPATGFAQPPLPPSPPPVERNSTIRRRPNDGVSRTASWQGEQSASNGNGRRRRADTQSTIRASTNNYHADVQDSPRSTKSAGGRASRVSFTSPPPLPTPSNPAARATHKPPISKRERQRRTEDLKADFENFNVMDLAPPPSRARGLEWAGEDGSELGSGSGAGSVVNMPKARKAGKAKAKSVVNGQGHEDMESDGLERGANGTIKRSKSTKSTNTVNTVKRATLTSTSTDALPKPNKPKPKPKAKPAATASASEPNLPLQMDYYGASQSLGITAPPPPSLHPTGPGLGPAIASYPTSGMPSIEVYAPGPPRRRVSTTVPGLLGSGVNMNLGGVYGSEHGPYGQVGQQQSQAYGQYGQYPGQQQMQQQHPHQQQPYYELSEQPRPQSRQSQCQPQHQRPTFPSTVYNDHGELTPPSSEYYDQFHPNPTISRESYSGSGPNVNRARSTSPAPNAGHSLSYGPSSPWHVMVRPEAVPSRKYARSGLSPTPVDEDEQRLYDDDDEDERERDGRTASGSSSAVGTGTSSSHEGQRQGGQYHPSPRKEMIQARERERERQAALDASHGSPNSKQGYNASGRALATGSVAERGGPPADRSNSPPRMLHHVPTETIYSEDPRSLEARRRAPPLLLGLPMLGAIVGSGGGTALQHARPSPTVQVVEAPARSADDGALTTPPLSAPSEPQGLAPPTFSVQPPTPQYEVGEPQMEIESPSPFNASAPRPAVEPELEKRIDRQRDTMASPRTDVFSMGERVQTAADGPEGTTSQPNSQPSSAGTSQVSSPHSSSDPSFSLAKRMKTSSSNPSMPPAPVDPDAAAFLKWDPRTQRWMPVPVNGLQAPPAPRSHRAESVISSVSAYSQASAAPPALGQPLYTSSRTRRQSLPHLSMNMAPPRPSRRAQSPSPSTYNSRPTSPAPSEAGYSRAPPSPTSAYGFSGHRMSIEPPHRMETSTLTLLPELREDGTLALQPASASRPGSRPGSVQDFRDSVRNGSMHNLAFPRANGMSLASSPATSENGDDAIPEDEEVDYSRPKSRQNSVYATSQYGGSQFGDNAGPRRASSVAGREPGLATMSVRSDAVPLFQSDGADNAGGNYTSLIMPTGTYKPNANPTKDLNKIDARVLGMPQGTMSTITMSGTAGRHSRRNSVSSLFRPPPSPTPAHLMDDLPAPVAFSSTVHPPTKISDSQILVQVYAVALDRYDAEMVRTKAASGDGAGKWIPGRAFFGRALEVGGEVRAIIKGDLVIGLVDIRKSGMLAEYVTCDRRRIARVPMGITLSQEEITCLPLLGVMAHRACIAVPRGSRALITNAHEGIGSLVCQELAANGVLVTAQVPVDVDSAEDDAWDNGAREVLVGDPIPLINSQHESGFDYILDTVGGRKIYDASRRIMRTQGRFVTTFGDDVEHTTSTKSSLHALRRAFVKKDKKAINYVHLLPGGGDIDPSGQDTRDILELPIMAEYRPKVGMVLPFERAPEAFEELMGLFGLEEDGKGRSRGKEVVGEIVVRLNN